MTERTTRPLTQEEQAKLAAIARGYDSLGGLAATLLLKILWIVVCMMTGFFLLFVGVCVLLAGKGDESWTTRLLFAALGLLPLSLGLAILFKVANSQNNQWRAWRFRRHAAQQALADRSATLTTYRFRRAASVSRHDTLDGDLTLSELEDGGTLYATSPDYLLSGDLTTGLEFVHAGPFELAIRPVGDPLPRCAEFAESDCQPEVLTELIPGQPDPALPPGWRILDEPFDALLARLRQPA